MKRNGNILTVVPDSHRTVMTDPLYQYDYGQRLVLDGIDLPETYEVHFSNTESGDSTTSIGNSTGVDIPDTYLTKGREIHAWLYLHTGEDDGETVYKITIPVRKRAKVTNVQPTPVQQDVITQTIAALNAGVGEADAKALEAEGYAAGTQNNVPVEEGSEYYHNNAKYYAEHALEIAKELIDDTAGTGDKEKVWSADKSTEMFNTKLNEMIDDTAGAGTKDKTWSADKITEMFDTKVPELIDDNVGEGVTNKTWSADKITKELDTKAPVENPSFHGVFSEGNDTHPEGNFSHAQGIGTVAKGSGSNVLGRYNVPDSFVNWPEWVAYTNYAVGNKVKRPIIVDI